MIMIKVQDWPTSFLGRSSGPVPSSGEGDDGGQRLAHPKYWR